MKKIKTPRLILRTPKAQDVKDFFAYASDPEVGPRAGWSAHTTIEQSYYILESFIIHKDVWSIVHKEDKKMIGTIGLHYRDDEYEVGYVLSKDYWSRGLMSEALHSLLDYAFHKRKLPIIYCGCFPDNKRSKRVIEKAGFKFIKEVKNNDRLQEFSPTRLVFSLTKEEFEGVTKC
jgi:RimJ/RimL family protein N-acetyltransferase